MIDVVKRATFEYFTAFARNFLDEKGLAYLGRHGWELCSVHVPPTGVVVYHFKRRKRK